MIDNDAMGKKFKKLCELHLNINCCDSTAITAEYAAVYEGFYWRNN